MNLAIQNQGFCYDYDNSQCKPSYILCILEENTNEGCGKPNVCPDGMYVAPVEENPSLDEE